MYITTFYSFKGGVGRSMALANVAVELAKRGRRVLAVDFDLEAPGLDTFDILRPQGEVPGVIDFVREYVSSGRAPDAREFMSRLPAVGDHEGELWIMPSGAQRADYAVQFNNIDWAELYEKRDGYLLFEDLKAQWEQVINPDYVLIDSRTGHTDTGGICTRQLPDAVAILFFPNEQNLRGLTKVVKDVRAEAAAPRRKEIDLHFVMSNVPDLDDEDSILREKIDAFREELGFEGDPMVVHRYDSLSLLKQVVFTKERPKSRLAREYCDVVRRIVGRNLADRDGALDYIRRASSDWRRVGIVQEPREKVDERLRRIEKTHSQDGDVLFALGAFFERDRQEEYAASLFGRAIDAGCDEPEAYFRRALVRADDDPAGAMEDALRVLQAEGVPPPLVREAARLVIEGEVGDIADSVAVRSLEADDRIWLANGFQDSQRDVGIAVCILEPLVGDASLSSDTRAWARSVLALRYIGMGKCAAAAALLCDGGRGVEEMHIQDAFNYGMANWGATGGLAKRPFARVVELDEADPKREHANYLQCLAVACWVVAETEKAVEFVNLARTVASQERSPVDSCWHYRRVPLAGFLEDLGEIEALINGDTSRKPHFMTAEAAPD